MSENRDYKNNSTKHDDTAGLAGASESKRQNGKKRKILIYSLIAVLLIGIGIGGVFLFNQSEGGSSSNTQVTVTFDSMGGSEIESQTMPKGERLTKVDTPSRSGYIFAGWYYEEAPVNAYKADDVFSEDTTLYAGWYEPDMEVDKAEYIKGCDSSISFVVYSEAALTDANLSDYIDFASAGFEDGKTLSVKQQPDGYLLYAEGGFTPGNTYSIVILDTQAVSFIKAGDKDVTGLGINNYNFTIYKENINNVVPKTAPKPLSSDDVQKFEVVGNVAAGETDNEKDIGKTIYRALMADSDGDFKAGDFISLDVGGQDSAASQYYKIIKVTKDDSGLYLYMVTPEMNELYSDFELYYTGDAVTFEEDKESYEELKQTLQTALKKSKGYDFLARTIAINIKSSPTLQRTVAGSDAKAQQQYQNLSVSALTDLLKNVSFDISFGTTKDITNKDNGVYGRIKFSTGDIDIDLSEGLKLTLNFSMSEDVTETAYGWLKMEDLDLYIYNGVYLNNKFGMSFSAVIATDSGKINITEEIQNLIDSQSDDKTQQIVDDLNKENLFGEDLDYVEILSKELGKQTVSIYEILTIQFKLDFKVSLGMRVSLDLNFSSTEERQIGMSNINFSSGSLKASKTEMKYTNQRLFTELHFTATLKGKMGIRAGVEAGVNFSVAHMNSVLSFGFTAEVGVYEEISGYIRFDYDYVNSPGRDPTSSTSLAGGLMSEMGIYVELSFTWDLFTWEGSVTIADIKFPILKIGALEFASEFEKKDSAVTFNTTSYNIKNSTGNLLKLKYIDISGGDDGVTINVKLPAANDAYAFFRAKDATGKGNQDDLKYVSVSKDTGMVTVKDNAPERLDFTVVTQYTKGCSLFSKDLEMITKNINFTYMKYQVKDSSQKYKATFYLPDGSVLEQKEYYVGQVPVPPALTISLEIDLWDSPYKMKDWSKPWKEEIKPLYADTDYHMDTEPNLVDIYYHGRVYNEATGKYEWGDIAVVPSLVGELPIPPMFEVEKNTEPGYVFMGWWPELEKVGRGGGQYFAYYGTDTTNTWTSFYVDGEAIAVEYVPKGDMPVPPDMSKYNTDERQFVDWWPSLHTTDNNFEYYYAEFAGYVNITFKDRDGKVISTQRILSGETPTAPEVPAVFEGEEEYYEYRFGGWKADDGAMMGRASNDRVYMPIYNTTYLEVTTIFDADGYAFADGTKTKEFKGTYANNNFLYMPKISYRDEYAYEVDYWQSTEMVNGSYVRLNMSDRHTDYKYNLTFKPVFKITERLTYTVRFDGGDETLYFTGRYGDTITSDMLVGLKKTSLTNNYVYVLSDYGLELPYSFGTVLDADGLPAVDINVEVQFTSTGVSKTFTFDANGGKFADNTTAKTITGPYGSEASFSETPVKADDAQYAYTFVGWSYEPDATTGNSFGSFIINGDSTLYAVYSRTPLYAVYSWTPLQVTLVFNASPPGHFADGSTQKTVQIASGSAAPVFSEVPMMDSTDEYYYTFTGWSPAYVPGTVVTSDMRFDAQYSSQYWEYTVTFDAGAGTFAGGGSTLTQTYHYGDTIVPPADPVRAGGTGYEYVFDGWQPALTSGMTVTWSRTFTAAYHAVGTGELGETGIIVSDGVTSEDINVGGINGYTYEMTDYGGLLDPPIPMLTVSGDGLTFSGSSDSVYITVGGGVSAVTFSDLALSGSFAQSNAVLYAQEGTTNPLTVNIAGNCTFANSAELAHAAYLDRPVVFQGIAGSNPTLSFTTPGNLEANIAAIYASANVSLEAKDLELTVTSANGYPIISDGDDYSLTFDNVHLTVSGAYGIGCNRIVIKGAADVSFRSVHPSESIAALYAKTELSFEGFTGIFQANNSKDGPAVVAGDIIFDVPDNYDLHGAKVKTYNDEYGQYDIFVTADTDTILSAVTVGGD